MRGDAVVVATMTLARGMAEEEVLRTSLDVLRRSGMPVVVSDGGSTGRFVSFLETLEGVTLAAPRQPGLVGQVMASLRAAREGGALEILYTEPDKQGFFAEKLADFLAQARGSGAPLAIAARSLNSFATFPATQRFTETVANQVVASCTGVAGDYCYGPFVMRADVAGYLADDLAEDAAAGAVLPGSVGWGWRPFLFTAAHRLGRAMVHIVDDFPCPIDQRQEDEGQRVHRLRQLAQNIDGVARAMALDLSRLRGERR